MALIAIEGIDGTGKGTQAELLVNNLRTRYGRNVLKMSYPMYEHESSIFVRNFLNGLYGSIDQVHPDLASLTYAHDRSVHKDEMLAHLALPDSDLVLDRYVASNLGHNGSKFKSLDQQIAFFDRLMHAEFVDNGMPEPDLNIVLLMDSASAQTNVDKKGERSYTSSKRDIHEADPNHLDETNETYKLLCRLKPERFIAIEAMRKGKQRSREAVQNDILDLVVPLLAA